MSGGGAQDLRGQDKIAAGVAGSVNHLKMRLQEGLASHFAVSSECDTGIVRFEVPAPFGRSWWLRCGDGLGITWQRYLLS